MSLTSLSRLPSVLALTLLGAGLGCVRTSPALVFHTLHGLAAQPAPAGAELGLAVEVLPFHLPDVLQRSQLVTALGPGRLELAPDHAWGNLLEKDMQRVLVENLGQLLGSGRVVASPYGPRVSAVYRVEVDVQRCDGRPGGVLTFQATWMLTRAKGSKALLLRRCALEVPVRGPDAEALVVAHNEALVALSREIAAALAGYR